MSLNDNLDVSVHDSHLVAVADRVDDGFHVFPHLRLREFCFLTNVWVEFSSRHVLQYKTYCIFLLIDLVDVDDRGVVQSDEHVDLVLGFENFVVVAFDGEHLSGLFPDYLPNRARRAV